MNCYVSLGTRLRDAPADKRAGEVLGHMVSSMSFSPLQVAPAIKEKMMKKGSLMLGYQPHRGKVNFFRQVVISPQVSREDMDFLLDEIDSLGRDM